MEDYVAKFQRRVKQINDDSKKFLIVNAGSMNHGKSSLFNSILDREEFKVRDVRETTTSRGTPWIDDVELVDTPGLNADEGDDIEAHNAYRRANMIVFVHNIKVGELHRAELDGINAIKWLFSDEKYFWNHFCLVFTNLDAANNETADQIVNKALNDIQSYCNGSGFQSFIVSNSRYKSGQERGKSKLVEASNIPAFREWLKSNFQQWLLENGIMRKIKINREKKAISDQAFEVYMEIKDRLEQKKSSYIERNNELLTQLQELFHDIDEQWRSSSNRRRRRDELEEEIENLRNRLERERANF